MEKGFQEANLETCLFFSRIWWREVLKVVVDRGFLKSQCQNVERCVRVCDREYFPFMCIDVHFLVGFEAQSTIVKLHWIFKTFFFWFLCLLFILWVSKHNMLYASFHCVVYNIFLHHCDYHNLRSASTLTKRIIIYFQKLNSLNFFLNYLFFHHLL